MQRIDDVYEDVAEIKDIPYLISLANFHFDRKELYKAAHCLALCIEIKVSKSDVELINNISIAGEKVAQVVASKNDAKRFICYVLLKTIVTVCDSRRDSRKFYQQICSAKTSKRIDKEISSRKYDPYYSFFNDFRYTSQPLNVIEDEGTNKHIRPYIYLLAVTIIAAVATDVFLVNSNPSSSALVSEGEDFRRLLAVWFILLIATWVFAYITSKRKNVYQYICPTYSFSRERFYLGEIMSFKKDYFFHIFQFVWIPFGFFGLLSIEAFYRVDTAAYFDHIPMSDQHHNVILLAISCAVAIAFIVNQIRIQKTRIASGVNFYWWDWRVDKTEYCTRLTMVFVDTAFGVFLAAKITVISYLLLQLISSENLEVQYFHPDGTGGFSSIIDVYTNIMWIVIIFGAFVISSLYLHRKLLEYRVTDALLVIGYLFLLATSLYPLFVIEGLIDLEKQKLLSNLVLSQPPTVNEISALNEFHSLSEKWSPSSISFEIKKNPMLPLIFQAGFILIQLGLRMRKTPTMIDNESLTSQ